jgi:hypothetical protein
MAQVFADQTNKQRSVGLREGEEEEGAEGENGACFGFWSRSSLFFLSALFVCMADPDWPLPVKSGLQTRSRRNRYFRSGCHSHSSFLPHTRCSSSASNEKSDAITFHVCFRYVAMRPNQTDEELVSGQTDDFDVSVLSARQTI